MDAAAAIRLARLRADLSKRELARRAETSPAAIVNYEAGRHAPTYPTLARIVGAAGFRPRIELDRMPHDRAESARRLKQVLELAAAIPRRHPARRHLAYPPFPRARR
jgi:transcriptional regulator with XRE-family HTH domain